MSERLKIGIQKFYERPDFTYDDQINIVLTNEKQLMLNDIQSLLIKVSENNIFLNDNIFLNYEKIQSSISWDFSLLNRCQLEFTNARLLYVNNNTITFDPISGVPLPTCYYDPGTKENIGTLKNEFISLIVIDDLSSSPKDLDFKSKLIR